MLAARDQENLVHSHQQVAASKPLNQSTRSLQPKTPGNRYPKTPLKLPLNDENAPGGVGGKSGKGKGLENMATGKKGATFNQNDFVTPMGPRTRAPLGMKTTNAKAKVFQTPAISASEKEIEKGPAPQTSARRPKRVTYAETSKISVHGDESPLHERDVEYAPPKPKDIPYESEDFPMNCLNYDALKPGNLMRGIYHNYHNPVDENGLTRLDREYEASYQKSIEIADERVNEMLKEDWTIGDVPETFRHLKKKQFVAKDNMKALERKISPISNKGPATIASRKAASALSVAHKPTVVSTNTTKSKHSKSFLSRPKPAPAQTSNPLIAEAASRSTIGYTKGRNASTALKTKEGGFTRSVSNLSQTSDKTITPARFTEHETESRSEEWRRLKFLGAFDVDEDHMEPGLRGALPECLRKGEEDEDDFVMTLNSS